MHMENGLKSADPRDCTGYTGWAGEEEEPTILLFLGLDYILSPQITSLLNSVRSSHPCPPPPPRFPPISSRPLPCLLFPSSTPIPSPSPGIALLYLHLHGVFGEPSFLQKALDYVGHSLTCPTRRRDVTFLCVDAGPLAVAAVVYHRVQRAQESDECLSRSVQDMGQP